jgi:hypothetical protein
LPVQSLTICPPVAGRAAVVDVDDREPAARPELRPEAERRSGVAGRAAVTLHDQRRELALWGDVVGVLWGVVEGVRGQSVLGRELDRLGDGVVRSVDRRLEARAQRLGCPGRDVDQGDLRWKRGGAGHDDRLSPFGGDCRRCPRVETELERLQVAGVRAKHCEVREAVGVVSADDATVVEERERVRPERPRRVAELGLHRA